MPARPPQNQYGQKMGAKGMRKRAQFVKATEHLLEKRTLRELTVAEIAQSAGSASTTFYAYFGDVTEVVLAAINETEHVSSEMAAIFEREWKPETAYDNCKALVSAYCDFWDRHFSLLRTRNLAADEGDRRFMKARHDATQDFVQFLQRQITAVHPDVDAVSISQVMAMMMERIPVITRLPYRRRRSRQRLIESAAFFMASALGGSGPLPKVEPRKKKAEPDED